MNIPKITSNYSSNPQFRGKYEVDASTAVSRNQVFTLGMLMSNFWIRDARLTCSQLRNNSVYGKAILNVNVDKERIVENILKMNNIKFTKLDTNA
ncbi:TPA: hypothetical protein IAC10_12970 [Candidatus Scatousia excrementigallinarum]|uniref:Uncharacterized protein n=1 Tax=Candidatus Scatousia excrementigallinarum TaxID=2840935 RepID=A0A9D1F0V6_9BACT|nr:hypothetical protein [Candidatus Scatousia excrementigallinarum]